MTDNTDALKARFSSLRDAEDRWSAASQPLDSPPETDTDPLAELPPETVAMAGDEAAPVDEHGGLSSPSQARASSPTLSVMDGQRAVSESHLRSRQATGAQRDAWGKVALALAAFQRATGQTQTFEQLAREHLKSETQLRADRKAGLIPPRPQQRLGSAVDSYAFHTRAHGRGTGGGRAFARKAFPPAARGGTIPKG